MAQKLEELFGADKMLAIAPVWDNRGDLLEIVCPLEIEGTVIEGLQFRLTARKSMQDEMVTAQVEYHPSNEAGGPLARIEWKPLSGHNNKGRGPKEWQNRVIEGCHHHSFDLNLRYAPKEIGRGHLPVALPLEDSPKDFDSLLQFVHKAFRIFNIQWVEVPPWEPALPLEKP
jgi:hypothetical protein